MEQSEETLLSSTQARRILEGHGITRPSTAILQIYFEEVPEQPHSKWRRPPDFDILIEAAKMALDENGLFVTPGEIRAA